MTGVSYKLFFTEPSIRWRFFLACVINFGQQATGQGEFTWRDIYGKTLSFHTDRFPEQLLDHHLPEGFLQQQYHPAD
jgi:hypothetical protein